MEVMKIYRKYKCWNQDAGVDLITALYLHLAKNQRQNRMVLYMKQIYLNLLFWMEAVRPTI